MISGESEVDHKQQETHRDKGYVYIHTSQDSTILHLIFPDRKQVFCTQIHRDVQRFSQLQRSLKSEKLRTLGTPSDIYYWEAKSLFLHNPETIFLAYFLPAYPCQKRKLHCEDGWTRTHGQKWCLSISVLNEDGQLANNYKDIPSNSSAPGFFFNSLNLVSLSTPA